MNIIAQIQETLADCIHEPEVDIDITQNGFKVNVNLGQVMAQDDALAVMKLSNSLTEWADKKGYEPEDTPFHFGADGIEIVFIMEFFKRI